MKNFLTKNQVFVKSALFVLILVFWTILGIEPILQGKPIGWIGIGLGGIAFYLRFYFLNRYL